MNQIILIIILINIVVSYKGFKDILFFDKYKFQVQKILRGERNRMLTSGFLHTDWLHLGFNMYALYLFSKKVLINFDTLYFIGIYLSSLIAGSLYALYQHKDEFYYSAVGASGAVSGIVFSAIMLDPNMELILFPIPIPLPGYIFGIGYLLYSIYGMKNNVGNIGHSAHLGGAIGGYVITIILKTSVIANNTPMIIIMGAIIVGLFLFADKLKAN